MKLFLNIVITVHISVDNLKLTETNMPVIRCSYLSVLFHCFTNVLLAYYLVFW